MPERFDFVIRGAGLSGLTLAAALAHAFPQRSILLVDPGRARLDRTIGSWSREPPPFPSLIEHSDTQLLVRGHARAQLLELGERRYHTIRWSRLREHLLAQLHDRVELRTGRIDALLDAGDGVVAELDGVRIPAKFAFDSRLELDALRPAPGRVLAWQRFSGVRVETDTPQFEARPTCFMDLRPSTPEQFAFANLVPERANVALIYRVEVAASPDLRDLDQRLEHDLHALHGLASARVLARERGVLPLSDQPWLRRVGANVLRIGIAGGRLEPSCGYAFTRILADNAAIVASLRDHGHPFALPREPARFRWLDGVLLQVLLARPALGPALFEGLFRRCRTATVLDLLDHRASLVALLEIMAAMPHKLTLASAGLYRALAWLRAPGRPALPPERPQPASLA